jgi:Domain of unknown function (DUF397)
VLNVDLGGATWRTSSHSGGNGGQCVEVAIMTDNLSESGALCVIRDSKDPISPVLAFRPGQWRRFTAEVKASRSGLA